MIKGCWPADPFRIASAVTWCTNGLLVSCTRFLAILIREANILASSRRSVEAGSAVGGAGPGSRGFTVGAAPRMPGAPFKLASRADETEHVLLVKYPHWVKQILMATTPSQNNFIVTLS